MNKRDEGRTVFVKLNGKWVEGTISTYVGDKEPNPGRELVEVQSYEFGYEIFDADEVHFSIPRVHGEYGWCDICESYCWGDCEANGLRRTPKRRTFAPYHKGDTGSVYFE